MRRISEHISHHPYEGSGEDSQGNPYEVWGENPEPVGIYAFDPGGSAEPSEAGRDAVVTQPTIYLPPGHPVQAHDQCTVRGNRYDVDGEPAQWVHPRRGSIGDVIKLRRVDG